MNWIAHAWWANLNHPSIFSSSTVAPTSVGSNLKIPNLEPSEPPKTEL